MGYHSVFEPNSDLGSETERVLQETTEARIVEAVVLLSRNCPPEIRSEKAREELLALKPHLEEALDALADLKGCRSLTDEELSQYHTFRTLLACTA
jgi:hypothetical protein